MDWFSLSLLCAFSLATADALTKKHLTGYSGWALLLIRFVVPGVILAPFLFAYPLPTSLALEFWLWVLVLVPLEIMAMLLYMQAIRDAPLSQTLPYLAFTPVLSILTGWLVLGEQVSFVGASGILLVVIGTYLLNIERLRENGENHWLEPLRAISRQQGSRRMLIVALIYSLTSVGTKAAMQYVGPMNFGAFYFTSLAIVTILLVIIFRPKELKILTVNPGWHLLIGSLMSVMVITHFLAISKIEAAYMIAVKRTSLLFGILYGFWFFHEKGLLRNFSSVLIMVVGVALILLA